MAGIFVGGKDGRSQKKCFLRRFSVLGRCKQPAVSGQAVV
jgi:hypothetical protein